MYNSDIDILMENNNCKNNDALSMNLEFALIVNSIGEALTSLYISSEELGNLGFSDKWLLLIEALAFLVVAGFILAITFKTR